MKNTDKDYQTWIRKQLCCITGRTDNIEYSHVRSANNSGIGYKPEFSGVPMTKQIHALQHQKGVVAVVSLINPMVDNKFIANDWLRDKAAQYLAQWKHETRQTEFTGGML
jgi:hypothetical protein